MPISVLVEERKEKIPKRLANETVRSPSVFKIAIRLCESAASVLKRIHGSAHCFQRLNQQVRPR